MVRYLRSGVLVPVVIHVTLHGHWDNFLCFDFDGSGMWGPPSWEWHRIVASESWVLPAQNDPTCNAGWWFGTGFIFPYIGNNHPNWRTHIFQRGGSTTNQVIGIVIIPTDFHSIILQRGGEKPCSTTNQPFSGLSHLWLGYNELHQFLHRGMILQGHDGTGVYRVFMAINP